MKFTIFMMILVGVLGSCQSQHFTKLQQTDSIPLDPAVRYGRLDNGFTYYLRKTDQPESTIQFHLVVKAGIDYEDEDQVEYAHLLEHLLAKETKNFPNLSTYFHQAGRHRDAKTVNPNTNYEVTIPANDKQVFHDGLQVLRDWAQGNTWKPGSIAVERAAIEGEMRTSDPYRYWKENILEKEALGHLGYRANDLQKSLQSIKNFDPKAFYRFYDDWHRPDLQAAIIIGNIPVDSLEMAIKQKFSDLKIPKNPKSAKARVEAQTIQLDGKIHFATINDSVHPELKLEILRLRPNLEYSPVTRADYRNMLLQKLYLNMLQSKAKQFEQQYDPPFSTFSANYRSNTLAGRQLNATLISIELENDNLKYLQNQFQKALRMWKQMHNSFNHADLDRSKEQLNPRYKNDQLIPSKFLARRYQDHFLHGKAAPHPKMEEKLITEILKEIELGDIQRYIQEYGSLSKDTNFIFFKGSHIEIPPYGMFEQWVREIDTMIIKPLQAPDKPIQSLADVVKLPESHLKKDIEIIEDVIGISTVELPNGITLVLKPTNSRTDLYKNKVSFQAFRSNQIPLNNKKKYLAAKMAPEVIQFSGAGPYNKFELERFLQEKEMKLQLKIDKDNQLIYGESKVADLTELFNLLYLYLENPRKDQLAFNAWKTHKKKILQGKGLRGSKEFIMKRIIPLWYPEVPVLEMEDLQELTQEEIYKAAAEWFADLRDFTFIFTGDFNTEEVLPVLIKTLSTFPVKDIQPQAYEKSLNFPLKKMEENLEFKNMDGVYARLFFPVKVKRELKIQIKLQLLSTALNQRIWQRLREGSYVPVARGEWLDVKNGIFAFRIDFDTALGDEKRMLNMAREEFRNLRDNGVDPNWLKTAITEELRTYESRFASFGYFNFWPDYLQLKLENAEDPVEGILMYGTILEHFITLEDMNAAAKEYLKENNLQQLLSFPEGYQQLK